MKKKGLYLLFLMVLSASFLVSCSKEDNNENNENEGIVPSLTGAITKEGINFDNPELKCTKVTYIPAKPTLTRAEQVGDSKYSSIRLDFNDNLQVTIRSIVGDMYADDPLSTHVYRILKYCGRYEPISPDFDGNFIFNLLQDGKIVSSETLDPPPAKQQWWETTSGKSSFTLNLDSKGKEMAYKGQIKFNIDK